MNFYIQFDQNSILQCKDLANQFSDHISVENFEWIRDSLINIPDYISSICSDDPTLKGKVLAHLDLFLILFS
jgi:hypothetical protein